MAVSEIISNFAALKSMRAHRSVANYLMDNAIGGVVGVQILRGNICGIGYKNEKTNKEIL